MVNHQESSARTPTSPRSLTEIQPASLAPSVMRCSLVYGVAGLGGVAMGGALADRAPRAAMLARS